MKKERLEIFQKLLNGELTPEQADNKLINLISNKIGILSDDSYHGKSRWIHSYEDAPDDSQNEIEGYQWALNDVNGLFHEN